MTALRLLALLLPLLVTVPTSAATLYKSVGTDGTITFSDMPPAAGTRILAQREMPEAGVTSRSVAKPTVGIAVPLDYDAEIAHANGEVDFAERALAQARQGFTSRTEGLRLVSLRMSASDEQRVEQLKRGVTLARQNLLQLMRDRRMAAIQAAR